MSNLYSEEFRAQAYLALKAAGYPQRGSLAQVAATLNIPKHTLRRWATTRPQTRRRQTKTNLQDVMLGEVYRILNQLSDKRGQATYRQLTATLTSLVNSVRDFDELPPELLECGPLLNDIVDHVKTLGWSTRTLFEGIEDEMAQEIARRQTAADLKAKNLPVGDHP